jgi:hypothetical protein
MIGFDKVPQSTVVLVIIGRGRNFRRNGPITAALIQGLLTDL